MEKINMDMNLYKIRTEYNKSEFYIIGKNMHHALLRAQEKFTSEIIGIWLIEENVVKFYKKLLFTYLYRKTKQNEKKCK